MHAPDVCLGRPQPSPGACTDQAFDDSAPPGWGYRRFRSVLADQRGAPEGGGHPRGHGAPGLRLAKVEASSVGVVALEGIGEHG